METERELLTWSEEGRQYWAMTFRCVPKLAQQREASSCRQAGQKPERAERVASDHPQFPVPKGLEKDTHLKKKKKELNSGQNEKL